MAGRPTFKCRKIVIEPAVDIFWSISKIINATSMKMKNNILARGEKRTSRRVAESAERTKSKLIFAICERISNLLKGIF